MGCARLCSPVVVSQVALIVFAVVNAEQAALACADRSVLLWQQAQGVV